MKIAYSREAMHGLLALKADKRAHAVNAVEALADPGGSAKAGAGFADLLPLAEGSEFRLAPFSAFGDLVVTTDDDTLVVVALSNVIGSLKEATEL